MEIEKISLFKYLNVCSGMNKLKRKINRTNKGKGMNLLKRSDFTLRARVYLDIRGFYFM